MSVTFLLNFGLTMLCLLLFFSSSQNSINVESSHRHQLPRHQVRQVVYFNLFQCFYLWLLISYLCFVMCLYLSHCYIVSIVFFRLSALSAILNKRWVECHHTFVPIKTKFEFHWAAYLSLVRISSRQLANLKKQSRLVQIIGWISYKPACVPNQH